MKDFRVVHAKAILKMHSIAPIRGFLPPSIVVIGERFDRAQEVVYNGLQADEFIVSSPSRIIIRIPPSQVGKEIRDLKILSSVSLTRLDAVVQLEISKPPKMVEGIDRLVQAWLLIFYSTPGSDIFNKTSGGGGLSLVGKTTDRSGKNVAADLAQSVDRTKAELFRLQSGNSRIPPEERLLSSEMQAIQFHEATTTISARVSIQNILSQSAEISIR